MSDAEIPGKIINNQQKNGFPVKFKSVFVEKPWYTQVWNKVKGWFKNINCCDCTRCLKDEHRTELNVAH